MSIAAPGPPAATRNWWRLLAIIAGPLAALAGAILPPAWGLGIEAQRVAGLAIWMALWWASEAAPIAATSLLPLVFLPLMGVADERAAAAAYANPIVLFLLGGFIIALGIERWGLHARVAFSIVARFGARPRAILAGFMLAAALISMWISNTATALMLAPIALSLAQAGGGGARFAQALMLGLAWAATIGGLATPVGTPTNLIAIAWLQETHGVRIAFSDWLAIGLPACLAILPAAWLAAIWGLGRETMAQDAHSLAKQAARALGVMAAPEIRLCAIFALVAGAWVLGEPLRALGLGITDMGVAIAGALAMLLVPAGGQENRSLLTWEEAAKAPWDVVLLFGGGLSLAGAMQSSGLATWMGQSLAGFAHAPPVLLALLVTALVIILTEFMSNVAAITLLLPILGALAQGAGLNPIVLIVPAAIASSCGFMMPAGTGPNAVAYGSGLVPMRAMIGRGLFVNFASLLVMTWIGLMLAPLVLG